MGWMVWVCLVCKSFVVVVKRSNCAAPSILPHFRITLKVDMGYSLEKGRVCQVGCQRHFSYRMALEKPTSLWPMRVRTITNPAARVRKCGIVRGLS
jgi:hypothetical protein